MADGYRSTITGHLYTPEQTERYGEVIMSRWNPVAVLDPTDEADVRRLASQLMANYMVGGMSETEHQRYLTEAWEIIKGLIGSD